MKFSPAVLHGHLAPLIGDTEPVMLVIALSGGADSAALADAAATLARTERRLGVRALHVDHGLGAGAAPLRGAAIALADALGLPLRILAVEVDPAAPGGLEAAARAARYGALEAALAPAECLLTAHHLEDQAETLLLQLLRGAGLRGLAAMPSAAPFGSGRLLRPLLGVPRATLRAYAQARGLAHHEDPMNADPRFDRAYLRHELWPRLTHRWPQAALTVARSASHIAAAQRLLDEHSAELIAALEAGPALSVEALLALPAGRRGELLRAWLARQGLSAPPARRQARIEAELLRARGAGLPRMAWAGAELRTFAGFLYAFAPLERLRLAGRALPGPGEAALPLGELGALGRLEVSATTGAGLKWPAPGAPYTITARTGGERLRLRPDAPRRALKDLLREARLPPWARERAILIEGSTLAAVVLPHATWIAAEHAAGPGEAGVGLLWRGAPAALLPAPARRVH